MGCITVCTLPPEVRGLAFYLLIHYLAFNRGVGEGEGEGAARGGGEGKLR